MAVKESHEVAHDLTSTIISLQETIRNVRQQLSKHQQDFVFDPSQPVCSTTEHCLQQLFAKISQIGHLLDSIDAPDILSLAKPTSERQAELNALEKQLSTLQDTLRTQNQWHPPPTTTPIPCSTDYLDLSDLSTAVGLISDVVKYSNPSSQLTPQRAFASKQWTWDPLWREFFAPSHDEGVKTSLYLSRWSFDPRREIWTHANMADSGLAPDEAQMGLGSWEDWRWDAGCGEWGLDVSDELEEAVRKEGARLCVFASRWQERDGIWMYVGGRG